MIKGLQYLKSLHEVCQFQTTEKGTGVASGMELRRWLQDKCLVVNGLRIGPDDPVPLPVTSVVLFPKIKPGKNRRTTLL